MKEKNDLEQVAREENDALLCEIDAISKEIETMRHSRKKLMQQVEEKRNSCKKLHSQLSKEEQAKAHCFEELAAARLQLSSLGTVHKQQKAVIESAKVLSACPSLALVAYGGNVDVVLVIVGGTSYKRKGIGAAESAFGDSGR